MKQLRAAEDILDRTTPSMNDDGEIFYNSEKVIKLIRQAQREAIEAAAKKIHGTVYNGNGDEMQVYYKQSILDLLKQIK
jgi:hypothetical protein